MYNPKSLQYLSSQIVHNNQNIDINQLSDIVTNSYFSKCCIFLRDQNKYIFEKFSIIELITLWCEAFDVDHSQCKRIYLETILTSNCNISPYNNLYSHKNCNDIKCYECINFFLDFLITNNKVLEFREICYILSDYRLHDILTQRYNMLNGFGISININNFLTIIDNDYNDIPEDKMFYLIMEKLHFKKFV